MLALSGETLKVAGLTDISIWCEQFHLDPILRSIHNLFLYLSPHIHPITKQNQLLVYKSFCLFLLATFTLRHPWMKSPIYCQCLQTLSSPLSAPRFLPNSPKLQQKTNTSHLLIKYPKLVLSTARKSVLLENSAARRYHPHFTGKDTEAHVTWPGCNEPGTEPRPVRSPTPQLSPSPSCLGAFKLP